MRGGGWVWGWGGIVSAPAGVCLRVCRAQMISAQPKPAWRPEYRHFHPGGLGICVFVHTCRISWAKPGSDSLCMSSFCQIHHHFGACCLDVRTLKLFALSGFPFFIPPKVSHQFSRVCRVCTRDQRRQHFPRGLPNPQALGHRAAGQRPPLAAALLRRCPGAPAGGARIGGWIRGRRVEPSVGVFGRKKCKV